MKKQVFIAFMFSFFLFFVSFSKSFAWFFKSENKEEISLEDCTAAVGGTADLILKNIDKPFKYLSEEDKNLYYTLYKKVENCRNKYLEANKIVFRKKDWYEGKIFRIYPKTPLEKANPNKFTLLFLDGNVKEVAVLKRIYGDGLGFLMFHEMYVYQSGKSNRDKIIKILDREEKQPFCYVEGFTGYMKIVCPPYHLEKNFSSLIIKDYKENTSKEEIVSSLENMTGFLNEELNQKVAIDYRVLLYENIRNLIIWIEKEFGPKGRNLIPSVLEKKPN
ncbi:hypothetical protein F1847_08205 [Thermodesulfobacterium sp. TA1]|uniref:hypothetical protein n=1 Tax=Thermodesulfobacterium sp. TA1 TaxID=2234087 RepID=UPI0012319B4A|nr:hypothetical protein [Thermodesulfobacterium sp. TA1]QER42725.1 hypothetical protein F1847_08205 [Thermodesulfobacterium sp. TA1]